jgi:hypothetical protein
MDNNNAVEKVLGEPVLADFPEYVRKIRNNLFIVSMISIFMVIGDVSISPKSTIFGLTFNNLRPEHITQGLLAITTYSFVHFLWCAIDSLQEWRLRITGTRVGFITAGIFADENGDYPRNPRQSTLYNWWLQKQKEMTSLPELLRMTERLAALSKAAQSQGEKNNEKMIQDLSQEIKNLQSPTTQILNIIDSKRLDASLKRFDNAFLLFLRSQNLRWLIIECLTPLLIGAFSIFLLIRQVRGG